MKPSPVWLQTKAKSKIQHMLPKESGLISKEGNYQRISQEANSL